MSFFYEVTVTATDADVANRWVAWMRNEHLADVIRAGARSGRVIRLDDSLLTLLAQYEFESRASYERYIREAAPRLREEGLRRFAPPAVSYARRCGEVLAVA